MTEEGRGFRIAAGDAADGSRTCDPDREAAFIDTAVAVVVAIPRPSRPCRLPPKANVTPSSALAFCGAAHGIVPDRTTFSMQAQPRTIRPRPPTETGLIRRPKTSARPGDVDGFHTACLSPSGGRSPGPAAGWSPVVPAGRRWIGGRCLWAGGDRLSMPGSRRRGSPGGRRRIARAPTCHRNPFRVGECCERPRERSPAWS